MEQKFPELEVILQRLVSIENTIKQNNFEVKPHLSKKETAKFFGVSVNTVKNWVNVGLLKPYHIANRVYFKREELLEVLFNKKTA